MDVAIFRQSDYRNSMTMERNSGVVNELTFNTRLTVKLSVFSCLRNLINRRMVEPLQQKENSR